MSNRPAIVAAEPSRNAGLDALRAATTLLVVLHHTAITYGGQGGWFYQELRPSGGPSSQLLTMFCAVNQAWFMGLFFLLAGLYTPPSLQRKGAWRFVADRALRLGLPWGVFVLLLGPLTVALAQTAQGHAPADTLGRLMARHAFVPGPLWFAQALFGCSLAAVAWQALAGPARAWGRADAAFPSQAALWAAALGTGALAFALRLVWPVGESVAGMQPGYFASYLVLYAAGCAASRPGWLARIPPASARRWRRIAWCAAPVLPVASLLAPWVPVLAGRPEGGLSVPALVYAFWEPLLAWGVIGGLLLRFQRRLAQPGPLWRSLSRRAYAVFVIHPPVLVAVALAWASVQAPALLKFAITGAVCCLLCHLIAGALLRLPGVARVL